MYYENCHFAFDTSDLTIPTYDLTKKFTTFRTKQEFYYSFYCFFVLITGKLPKESS